MIVVNCPLYSVFQCAELVPAITLGDAVADTCKRAAILSCTSKACNQMVHSEGFLKHLSGWIGYKFPRFSFQETKSLKELYKHSRKQMIKEDGLYETGNGAIIVNNDVAEVLALYKDTLCCNKLGDNLLPPDTRLDKQQRSRAGCHFDRPHHVAYSDQFLAIYAYKESTIYVCKTASKEHVATYKLEGTIVYACLEKDQLYVVESKPFTRNYLFIFDLNQPENQNPVNIPLPGNNRNPSGRKLFSINKDYLICMVDFQNYNKLCALPVEYLKNDLKNTPVPWVTKSVKKEKSFLFPKNDRFIQVAFKKSGICTISQITIGNIGIFKMDIVDNLDIAQKGLRECHDVCLHDNRVIMAYESHSHGTTLIVYDLDLRQVFKVHESPLFCDNYFFSSYFLNTVTRVHYLITSSCFAHPKYTTYMLTLNWKV